MLDSSHQSKLDKLKSLNWDDFSKNYDQMQRDAHKDAVDLFGRYAKGGDNAELKQWASTTLPALQVAAVRWNVASNVVVAWILTMPAAGLIGAAFYQLCKVWP
jgi:predicted outer membrane protein